MNVRIFKTRRGTLKRKLQTELTKSSPNLEYILDCIDEYEASNLATIDKLKRKRSIAIKRINGALKQTITAHGPITKNFIGSASKRIMGALLSDPNDTKIKRLINKIRKWTKKN